MPEDSIFKCQIMHVNVEVNTSNFQNQPEVTQINRILSYRLKEYWEGELLEPHFFDRFRGNIEYRYVPTYLYTYIERDRRLRPLIYRGYRLITTNSCSMNDLANER